MSVVGTDSSPSTSDVGCNGTRESNSASAGWHHAATASTSGTARLFAVDPGGSDELLSHPTSAAPAVSATTRNPHVEKQMLFCCTVTQSSSRQLRIPRFITSVRRAADIDGSRQLWRRKRAARSSRHRLPPVGNCLGGWGPESSRSPVDEALVALSRTLTRDSELRTNRAP